MCEKTNDDNDGQQHDLTFDTYENVMFGDNAQGGPAEVLVAMHGVLLALTNLALTLGITLEDVAFCGVDKELSE